MVAAKGGHNETVQTLIAAGANLNIQSVEVLLTTFVYCYMFARLSLSTKDGWTALMIAARSGHNETVQTLIAAGADLNIQSVKVFLATFVYCNMFTQLSLTTKDGWTALMIAARGGHNETVQTLIAAGADLNIQSVKVFLATFVYCNMFTQLSLTTKDGRTALMIAAIGGHNDTVQTLIAAGADVSLKVRLYRLN